MGTRSLGGCALLAWLSIQAGCDDPKPDPAATTAAASVSAVASTAAPEPAAAPPADQPEPRKPRDCPEGQKLDFADAEVEAEVRRKLQKEKGDVLRAELSKVKSLRLSSVSLDGVDNCVFPHLNKIEGLSFGPGKIVDISPLAELTTLLDLRLAGNPVADARPLTKLTKLDRLDMSRTELRDLAPLSGMTDLTELLLDDTPVEDLGPLSSLTKLQKLSIKRTRVKDLAPLKGLSKLELVYVNGAPIEDVLALARPGLKVVED